MEKCQNCLYFNQYCRNYKIKDDLFKIIIELLEYVYPNEEDNPIITTIQYLLQKETPFIASKKEVLELIKYKRDIESLPQGHDEVEFADLLTFFKCKEYNNKRIDPSLYKIN
jgi:hypothetical protein